MMDNLIWLIDTSINLMEAEGKKNKTQATFLCNCNEKQFQFQNGLSFL